MERSREAKDRAAKRAREDRKKNPERWAAYDLKRHYGITLDQYNVLLESQNFVCKLCGNPELDICNKKGAVRKLAVDHDHKTGRIRGLLCRGCNQGLGNFKEDIQVLRKAIDYISSP